MADQDRDGPSLELPSFGFRRRRGKKARAAAEADSQPEPSPEPEPVAGPEPAPAPQPEPTRSESGPAPQPEPTVAAPQPEPTVAAPPAELPPEPTPEPETAPIPVARESSPEQPAASPEPSGRPLFADETAATATTVAATEDRVEPERGDRKPRKPLRVGVRAVPGASLTGALVGLATVGLTWGSLRLCELVRGASSCGGVGLLVLLLILVAMIFLGAGLLRLFRVSDPGSTSFLAIGLLTVVALLFLVDLLFNWWMIIVIPCVALLTYTLSSWVTTSFVDSGRG